MADALTTTESLMSAGGGPNHSGRWIEDGHGNADWRCDPGCEHPAHRSESSDG